MKQRVALLLAGVLVGALLMTVLPVSAHHAASSRRLQRQINALEAKARLLGPTGVYRGFIVNEQVLSSECADGATAVWLNSPQITDRRIPACAGAQQAFKASKRAIRSFKASQR